MPDNIQEKIVPIDEIKKALSPEKLEDSIIQSMATKRVIADPLPGPMLDAVANTDIEVNTSQGKVILRPVVAYDFTIFKKINSPHYKTMIERDTPEGIASITIEDEELYEMIYQFSHPCKHIRELLKKGRDHFREIATEEVGDKYDINDLNLLLTAIATQLQKGFSTMMAHGSKEDATLNDKNADALDVLEADKKKQ